MLRKNDKRIATGEGERKAVQELMLKIWRNENENINRLTIEVDPEAIRMSLTMATPSLRRNANRIVRRNATKAVIGIVTGKLWTRIQASMVDKITMTSTRNTTRINKRLVLAHYWLKFVLVALNSCLLLIPHVCYDCFVELNSIEIIHSAN
jgi:transcriptional accessory protein Tex/SPT6